MRVVGNLAESKHRMEAVSTTSRMEAARRNRVHYQQKVARFCAERAQCALLRRVFAIAAPIKVQIRMVVEAGWVVPAYELCLEECGGWVKSCAKQTRVSACGNVALVEQRKECRLLY